MTAYIDNIIIQGTPEEIQEFIELRKVEPSFGTTDYRLCMTCYSAPCQCGTAIRTGVIDFGVPDGYFSIKESGNF